MKTGTTRAGKSEVGEALADLARPAVVSLRVGRAAGIQTIVLPHPDADITLEPLPSGKRRVQVRMHDPAAHIWRETFETSLPPELVRQYLAADGPAGLC
jgi:hypothetical protein